MEKADLYIRVSTDEQADKGYSQRDQEERLRRYCENNSIVVGQVIYEDYSAKTFNRPEWIKLLDTLRKKSSRTNLLLFTKWDPFLPFAALDVRTVYNSPSESATSSSESLPERFSG